MAKDDKLLYDVFISYRRRDGAELAQVVYQALTARGYRVFMDVRGLPSGRFDNSLLKTIGETPDFVPVLTPECCARRPEEDDWFYREVEHALLSHRNVIPITSEGFEPPKHTSPDELMSKLCFHHAVQYSHEYADAAIDRLCRMLTTIPTHEHGGFRLSLQFGRWKFAVGLGLCVLAAFIVAFLTLGPWKPVAVTSPPPPGQTPSGANKMPQEQTGFSTTITDPRDGDRVSSPCPVRITVSREYAEVWVIVNPTRTSGDYWVQPKAQMTDDKEWTAQAYIGRPGDSDIGKTFRIRAVVNPKISLKEGDVLNAWPAAFGQSQIIEVIRK